MQSNRIKFINFRQITNDLFAGISASIFYILTFICAKPFHTMKKNYIALPGLIVIRMQHALAFLGDEMTIISDFKFNLFISFMYFGFKRFVGMFRVMPKTEVKSLAEIESHFMKWKKNSKKLNQVPA